MSADHLPDNWEQGDAYERYVGRWSRAVAPAFLRWLDAPPGERWLDIGCGTGALTEAIVAGCEPSWVGGVEPSAGFLDTARARLGTRAQLRQGSAEAIPFDDDTADVVVSGLVLNFVPDPARAVTEMARVTRPGGTVAAYVWDYAGGMELMRAFWDAAVGLDPTAPDEGARFPLCEPHALARVFTEAGLVAAETNGVEIPTTFSSFDDYWTPFLGGQGSAPTYAMSLSDRDRERLRDALRERVSTEPDGSIRMHARAWAVRASVPG